MATSVIATYLNQEDCKTSTSDVKGRITISSEYHN